MTDTERKMAQIRPQLLHCLTEGIVYGCVKEKVLEFKMKYIKGESDVIYEISGGWIYITFVRKSQYPNLVFKFQLLR